MMINTSSVSGNYSAIVPYVQPFFPPDPPRWLITALTPVDKIDNEEIQTE
jgi:hypothetical protein